MQTTVTANGAPADSRDAWPAAIKRRVCTRMPIKSTSVIAGTALFLWAYFAVMRTPDNPPAIVPVTRWDYLIPISEPALYVYASLWAYIPCAPALARDMRVLRRYWFSAMSMSMIGLAIFWLYPTAVPDLPIDWHRYPKLAFLKTADVSGNALPSMHVAFAVFTAAWIAIELRRIGTPWWPQAVNAVWAVAIVYSTMATRQHLLIDVAGGALLGALAILSSGPGRPHGTAPHPTGA